MRGIVRTLHFGGLLWIPQTSWVSPFATNRHCSFWDVKSAETGCEFHAYPKAAGGLRIQLLERLGLCLHSISHRGWHCCQGGLFALMSTAKTFPWKIFVFTYEPLSTDPSSSALVLTCVFSLITVSSWWDPLFSLQGLSSVSRISSGAQAHFHFVYSSAFLLSKHWHMQCGPSSEPLWQRQQCTELVRSPPLRGSHSQDWDWGLGAWVSFRTDGCECYGEEGKEEES